MVKKHLALVFALAMSGVAAACGGGTTPPTDTTPDKATDTKPADTAAGAQGTGEAKPADADKPAEKPADKPAEKPAEKPAASAAKSTPIQPSKMLEDVKKAGLSLDKLPDFAKMPLAQKKKLMPLFQKALGYQDCAGCHASTSDFKTETRNIKITRGMWKNFVVAVRDEKGGAVFCDTCHNGTAKNLDRSDHKAIEKFMEDEYEHKLTRADKKEMECSTCHGDAVEPKIIEKMWGIAAK